VAAFCSTVEFPDSRENDCISDAFIPFLLPFIVLEESAVVIALIGVLGAKIEEEIAFGSIPFASKGFRKGSTTPFSLSRQNWVPVVITFLFSFSVLIRQFHFEFGRSELADVESERTIEG
jgi:hypothetical protein